SSALLVGTGRGHLTGIATAMQLATLIIAIPPMSARWGILGAASADFFAVFFLTITLAATAWSTTRQVGWSVLKAAVVPVPAAVSSGWISITLTDAAKSDAVRLALGMPLLVVGYLVIITTLGGRSSLAELSRLLRSVVGRPRIAQQLQT